MALAMKATVTTMSSKPCWRSRLTTCSIMGRLAMGSIGLGWFEVSGRRRVPSPPAMITAFMGASIGDPTPPPSGSRGLGPARAVTPGRTTAAAIQARVRAGTALSHATISTGCCQPAWPWAEQEGGVGEHEPEGPGLADPQDVDALGPEGGQQEHRGRTRAPRGPR